MNKDDAYLVRLYGIFFTCVAIALGHPLTSEESSQLWSVGQGSLACVVGFYVAFLTTNDSPELREAFVFCAILSLFQPLPDLFLSKTLHTLVFDPAPFRLFGEHVPVVMTMMWTPAFLPVLRVARSRSSEVGAALTGLVAGPVWFFLPEHLAPMCKLWHPTPKVRRYVGYAATYVLVAEGVASAAVVLAHRRSRGGPAAIVVLEAALATCTYTGALAVAYVLVETF